MVSAIRLVTEALAGAGVEALAGAGASGQGEASEGDGQRLMIITMRPIGVQHQ